MATFPGAAWLFGLGVAFASLLSHAPLAAAEPREVRFNRDIKPILVETCWHCHGPGTQKAGLRLDRRDDALRETGSGLIPIVPGKPDDSEIIARLFATDPHELMPPPESNKVLKPEQKELLKKWVAEGAKFEKHWSFEPPVKGEVPKVEGAGLRVVNPIDAFIAQRLQGEGLAMSPEADKETLIRRVAFALTGLPPTTKEIDAYLADTSPQAYENLVDRYLAAPTYGEEMARHWLDLARYADTHGLHLDNERQMWAYRDWVVKAFNTNQPFDQFTIEQLAGDLLPHATRDQLTATGFNRCNVTTGEGGSISEEWIYRNAVDRTNTTAEVFLGLTAGCAVCHDHKFDPLSAKDYYSMYAFFQSAADPALDGNALLTAPAIKLSTSEQEQRLAELDALIIKQQKELDEKSAAIVYTDPATLQPPPSATTLEQVWFDDELPAGAKAYASPGHPTMFVTAEQGPVLTGSKSFKRVDKGIAQDIIEGVSLEIPPEAKLFAYVWIDPQDMPKTLMLQYHKAGWAHRAAWGDYDAIQWGKADSPERVNAGVLPDAGKWVRLEVDAAKVGLNAGDTISSFALTQFGGTVYWDKIGVTGRSDPAGDPRHSMLVWWKQQTGKNNKDIPADLAPVLKAGPEKPPTPELQKRLRDYYLQAVCLDTRPQLEPVTKALATSQQQRKELDTSIPGTVIFRELDKPRDSFVMIRGQYNKPGEKVEPNVPVVLPALKKEPADRRASRLDLAKWLVSAEQPLTARVTVNRFWQQFFGTGLVKSSFDFGSQGDLPSHPELLDWLAVSFREGGWNVKQLARLMVTSATFRQSSALGNDATAKALLKRDPENRLLARGPRFRLDAEQIRDNALFVSGLINLQMGGKGVKPYQPTNIWEPVAFTGSNTGRYVQDTGPSLYRRSLYTFLKRTAPTPFMSNFDAPNRETFCTKRERSNTPLQALQLMNDVQHFEAARALAERMISEGGATPAERIAFAYRTVLARRPEADEVAVVDEELQKHVARFAQDAASAKKLITVGESKPKAGLPEGELAAYTMIANMLLNLDETVNRN